MNPVAAAACRHDVVPGRAPGRRLSSGTPRTCGPAGRSCSTPCCRRAPGLRRGVAARERPGQASLRPRLDVSAQTAIRPSKPCPGASKPSPGASIRPSKLFPSAPIRSNRPGAIRPGVAPPARRRAVRRQMTNLATVEAAPAAARVLLAAAAAAVVVVPEGRGGLGRGSTSSPRHRRARLRGMSTSRPRHRRDFVSSARQKYSCASSFAALGQLRARWPASPHTWHLRVSTRACSNDSLSSPRHLLVRAPTPRLGLQVAGARKGGRIRARRRGVAASAPRQLKTAGCRAAPRTELSFCGQSRAIWPARLANHWAGRPRISTGCYCGAQKNPSTKIGCCRPWMLADLIAYAARPRLDLGFRGRTVPREMPVARRALTRIGASRETRPRRRRGVAARALTPRAHPTSPQMRHVRLRACGRGASLPAKALSAPTEPDDETIRRHTTPRLSHGPTAAPPSRANARPWGWGVCESLPDVCGCYLF